MYGVGVGYDVYQLRRALRITPGHGVRRAGPSCIGFQSFFGSVNRHRRTPAWCLPLTHGVGERRRRHHYQRQDRRPHLPFENGSDLYIGLRPRIDG